MTSHDLADRWTEYVAWNAATGAIESDTRLRDAFFAGAYAGLELRSVEAALEYSAYVAAVMCEDGTVMPGPEEPPTSASY